MRTLALLATLTIVAMAFAGCSGDGDGDGDSSSSSSSTSRSSSSSSTSTSRSATSTTSSSTTSTGPANRAPSGSISVSVNGTNATFALTGSDPDGDTLVWDLTFGDGNATNGTSLPTNVTHTYSAAGNFTANFTITDGKSPTAYNVVAAITGGSGSTGFSFAAAVAAWCLVCSDAVGEGAPTVPSASWFSGESGGDAVFTALTANLAGRAYSITSTGGDPDGAFMTACDPTATIVAPTLAGGPEAGTVPAGAGCILIWEFPPISGVPPGASTISLVVA